MATSMESDSQDKFKIHHGSSVDSSGLGEFTSDSEAERLPLEEQHLKDQLGESPDVLGEHMPSPFGSPSEACWDSTEYNYINSESENKMYSDWTSDGSIDGDGEIMEFSDSPCALAEEVRRNFTDDLGTNPKAIELSSDPIDKKSILGCESLELLHREIQNWESALSNYSPAQPKITARADIESRNAPPLKRSVNSKGIFKKRRFESISAEGDIYGIPAMQSHEHSKHRTQTKSKESEYPPNQEFKRKESSQHGTSHKRNGSVAAVRVHLPLMVNSNDNEDKKSKKRKDKNNPYQGNTPKTPVDVVHPNEKGVYNFTPSAAAFKWNWNLLDVRKRPVGGMTPQHTPRDGFKSFRHGFSVSPTVQKSSNGVHNFLKPNRTSSKAMSSSCESDGLPAFPANRKVAKAVRKRNLTYSPGGQNGGKKTEHAYQKIYEQLSAGKGDEPSNIVRRRGSSTNYDADVAALQDMNNLEPNELFGDFCCRVTGDDNDRDEPDVIKQNDSVPKTTALTKKKSNGVTKRKASDPAISARGQMSRSCSSTSIMELADFDKNDTYHSEYSPLIKSSSSKMTGMILGTRAHNYHIVLNLFYGALFLITAIISPYPPKAIVPQRRLASSQGSDPFLKAVKCWVVILGIGLIIEFIRGVIIYSKSKNVLPDESTSKGRWGASIKRAILSSVLALSLISIISMSISALACIAFTLMNQSASGGFIQKESRSFMWTVGLIHTGVASGLLTKKMFYKQIPLTTPAFQMMGKSRISVLMGCLFPAILGWFGIRIIAQILKPSWHSDKIDNSSNSSSYDFIGSIFSMIVSILEYFEAMGYWKVFLWWLATSTVSLLLLDFVNITISLAGQFYNYGGIAQSVDKEDSMTITLFIKLLAQAAIATGLATGSFWQWPLNIVTVCYAKFNSDKAQEPTTNKVVSSL